MIITAQEAHAKIKKIQEIQDEEIWSKIKQALDKAIMETSTEFTVFGPIPPRVKYALKRLGYDHKEKYSKDPRDQGLIENVITF